MQPDVVEVSQFHELLSSLQDSEVMIRLREFGRTWTGLSKVIIVSGNAVIIQTDLTRTVITNLRTVAEFAIDKPHMHYLPNVSYQLSGW